MVLAAVAVDAHAPLGLATAGRIRLIVAVIAFAALPTAVEAGEFVEIDRLIGVKRPGFRCTDHLLMVSGRPCPAQHRPCRRRGDHNAA
ncbi:hypothetical protein HER21_33860 [Pseudomonas sp. BGM005]|nr:hypothetical protein [Pseudomonas sp. BG5]